MLTSTCIYHISSRTYHFCYADVASIVNYNPPLLFEFINPWATDEFQPQDHLGSMIVCLFWTGLLVCVTHLYMVIVQVVFVVCQSLTWSLPVQEKHRYRVLITEYPKQAWRSREVIVFLDNIFSSKASSLWLQFLWCFKWQNNVLRAPSFTYYRIWFG